MYVIIDRNKLIEVTTLFHLGTARNILFEFKQHYLLRQVMIWNIGIGIGQA